MLTLHFSNRLEPLLDALHEAMRPPASPFAAEQVIVPTAALERRVRLAIAERRGICAQVECGFLAQWLWRLIARLVPGVAAHSPFAPQRLGWRLYEALGDARVAAAQPRLAAYLQRCDALMRYELALRCAGLYEQYLTYRPDWLQAWDEGRLVAPAGAAWAEDERWQAALWAHVTRALGRLSCVSACKWSTERARWAASCTPSGGANRPPSSASTKPSWLASPRSSGA